MPNSPDAEKAAAEGNGSRLGKFIQTYHSFLSSFVIGAAGLIATSIWQYRQAEVTARQANTQEEVAKVQAENNWKIEKANILAKNLQVLASEGSANLEQRYGVLLSLTRGKILDPELAVSYALDLGKDSPEYMRSVLNNTEGKDYWRLARAFEPTCEQRYGVTRPVEICKVDKLADRSAAIAEMIADEIQGTPASAKPAAMALLADEQQAQFHATRLAWLFTPALINMYTRRQWSEIARFEKSSPGAQLISALVLASARTGELVSAQEAAMLEKFHAEHRKWLTGYMFENSCDAECRAKLVDFMLTAYEESEGDYDLPMRTLIAQPRSKSGAALSRLHSRFLWCQVDGQDLEHLRDRVLVPAAIQMLQGNQPNTDTAEDLLGLLAVTKRPREGEPLAAWKKAMGLIEKNPTYVKVFESRQAAAVRERLEPPPSMKKSNFCIPSPAMDNGPVRKAAVR